MTTLYIRPGATFNGDGSTGAAAASGGGVGAYNTWVGVTLTANNTYKQRRGTTYVGATVRPQSQVSASGTPLTISSYYNDDGSDDTTQPLPIIDHNGGTDGVGAVFVDTCANAVVENIRGTNSKGALGGAVAIRRSVGVVVRNCIGDNNEHGFVVRQDQASGTSVTTDVSFINCTAYNNVSLGICMRWGDVSTAILKRIKMIGNVVYGNGTGKYVGSGATTVPCGGIGSYTNTKGSIGTAGFTSFDIICDGNTVRDNNGYGINIEGFSSESWTPSISRNSVYGNGASLDVDSHSLWAGNCSYTVIEENDIHDNFANVGASSGSGVGIFVDYNGSSTTPGVNNIVRRNKVYNQFKGASNASKLTTSAGIFILVQNSTLVEANEVTNCRNGIAVGNGLATDGTLVTGNTIVNCTDSGISVLSQGTNTNARNNVIRGSATGLFVNTANTSGYSESYNSVSSCTIPKTTGTNTAQTATALDSTDITSDPLLGSNNKPSASSPLNGRGLHIGYRLDKDKRLRFNPPTIGAYEA